MEPKNKITSHNHNNKLPQELKTEDDINHFIRKCKIEDVKKILELDKPDIDRKDADGFTALDHAMITQNKTIISLILGYKIGASLENVKINDLTETHDQSIQDFIVFVASERKKLIDLAKSHDIQKSPQTKPLKKSLRMALDQYDSSGMTRLQHAVFEGNIDLVKQLIQQGANPKILTKEDRRSLLHLACLGDHRELCTYLIEIQKLNPNDTDARGKRPLHYAMASMNLPLTRTLIQLGGNPLLTSTLDPQSDLSKKLLIFSPLDMMFSLARMNAPKDPLQLSSLQVLTFCGIVAPWISQLCGGIPVLDDIGYLVDVGSFFIGLSHFESWKSALAYIGLYLSQSLLYPRAAPYQNFGWISGINQQGDSLSRWVLGLRSAFQVLQCTRIMKEVITELSKCFKNRSFAPHRSIRNAILYSTIGAHSLKHTADQMRANFDLSKIYDSWDEFINKNKNKFQQAKDDVDRFEFFRPFWENYTHEQPHGQRCPTLDPNICKGKTVMECMKRPELDATCKQHAKILLGLQDPFTPQDCMEAASKAFKEAASEKNPDNKQFADDCRNRVSQILGTLKEECTVSPPHPEECKTLDPNICKDENFIKECKERKEFGCQGQLIIKCMKEQEKNLNYKCAEHAKMILRLVGLPNPFTRDQCKKAFRNANKELAPDKHPSERQQDATKCFQNLGTMRDTLKQECGKSSSQSSAKAKQKVLCDALAWIEDPND